ncbi:death ligand signal enhancer-like isoform X1 [Zootermopsis nevadensis]|uniref:death ligand signal enhancer-like isoform X1 n=1 Tax=Zootermopsis nevadensis TaxID=136037 RepID=UPI000B8E2561|nr:death ligand signal enhancer-like isoform X1 [Zootermopsis nevadensis]
MMWKFLCRGIRETLERRINFTKKDKSSRQECPLSSLQYKLIPGIVSTNTFDRGTADLGGSCKNGSCNDKKQEDRQHHGEKWRHHSCIQEATLLGALGWSGIMVLGWYLCQPVCRHQCIQPSELERLNSRARLSRCHTEYASLFGILSHFVLGQPLSILPKNAERALSIPHAEQLQSSSTVSADVSDSPDYSVSEPKFGPVTADEALDEAAVSLTRAQNTVISGIENRLGVACMQLGRYKEAHTYFQRAVELSYAPAAFNLGLCYETGVGTPQDFKLAAKYYELASKWGHATAMYNLGVFYVHGWGGVPVDCNHARQLFIAAAKLGQTNAQEALSMVPPATDDSMDSSEPEAVLYEPPQTNVLYQILGMVKLRQSVAERPISEQNIPPVKSDAIKALYQALGTEEPEVLENTVGKTVHEEQSSFNLHNELNKNNVAVEPKDVHHLSIVC